MKAILNHRIYLDTTPELEEKLERELTYTLPPRIPTDPPIVIKTFRRVRPGLVTIPGGRLDLIPHDHEIVDKRVKSPIELPEFKFDLRPSQEMVYSEVDDNAIINAWVSWGKTFTGLAIAGKLKQKTLVVTHTTNLRSQWEKEVEKVYGIRPGRIGGGVFDTQPPIVCGNIQTLYRKIKDIKHLFGTIILDEMHHVSSPTFTRIIDEMPARYKIGLTGTLERKDGRHVVFRDYFGNHVLKPPKENFMTPSVDIIKSEIRFLDGRAMPWASKVNHLCYNREYIDSVSVIASAYAARGHKVLVVSNRVHFLKTCSQLVGDIAVHVTGDMDFAEREKTINKLKNDKNVLFGTQSIFSEGISIDELSCLILATPINNEPLLTQLIGRILRKKEDKMQPVVVDINLKGNTASRQNSARLGYYMKQGYSVREL